jgi:hypothetical protein
MLLTVTLPSWLTVIWCLYITVNLVFWPTSFIWVVKFATHWVLYHTPTTVSLFRLTLQMIHHWTNQHPLPVNIVMITNRESTIGIYKPVNKICEPGQSYIFACATIGTRNKHGGFKRHCMNDVVVFAIGDLHPLRLLLLQLDQAHPLHFCTRK